MGTKQKHCAQKDKVEKDNCIHKKITITFICILLWSMLGNSSSCYLCYLLVIDQHVCMHRQMYLHAHTHLSLCRCTYVCMHSYDLVPKGVQEKRTEVLENKVDRMWVSNAFFDEHMWSHPPVKGEGSAALRSWEIRLSVWFVTRCWILHITTNPHHCAANHAVNCENPTDLRRCDPHEYYQVNCCCSV